MQLPLLLFGREYVYTVVEAGGSVLLLKLQLELRWPSIHIWVLNNFKYIWQNNTKLPGLCCGYLPNKYRQILKEIFHYGKVYLVVLMWIDNYSMWLVLSIIAYLPMSFEPSSSKRLNTHTTAISRPKIKAYDYSTKVLSHQSFLEVKMVEEWCSNSQMLVVTWKFLNILELGYSMITNDQSGRYCLASVNGGQTKMLTLPEAPRFEHFCWLHAHRKFWKMVF